MKRFFYLSIFTLLSVFTALAQEDDDYYDRDLTSGQMFKIFIGCALAAAIFGLVYLLFSMIRIMRQDGEKGDSSGCSYIIGIIGLIALFVYLLNLMAS